MGEDELTFDITSAEIDGNLLVEADVTVRAVMSDGVLVATRIEVE